ncbi:MAG: ABC transporter substrate-binding protein [Lachnospiraceae bacterium]|nr:ABC transporter substrate-binding protein [Lachnospiraceae bacterium]
MKMKKLLALALAFAMVFGVAACSSKEENSQSIAGDTNNDGQIDMGTEEDVEVNTENAAVHMNSYEASTSGKWEAMFTPIEMEGRAIDMANFDLTPTADELAAMEKEPAYGKPVLYYMADGCTAGPTVANHLGYYEEAGLTSEGVKGSSYTEALGIGQATVAVGHIATMLVPITNNVDLTFVGGAHIGCKSLYVLADSEYNTTADLKGTAVSVPNGIGKSDYNITCLLLDADGINPQTDVTLTQVSADACLKAMQNGEISAALLSDTYAYGMVKDGTLKCIRSLLDEDFADENCCVIAMNRTFTQENPVISKKIVQAVQKAHSYMRDNPEEATQMLMDQGWNGGNYEMNVMLNNSLQFGLAQDFTEKTLTDVVGKYVRLGLIANMDNVDEIMDIAWTPVL